MVRFQELPAAGDIWYLPEVLRWLPSLDVLRVMCVCRASKIEAEADVVWRPRYEALPPPDGSRPDRRTPLWPARERGARRAPSSHEVADDDMLGGYVEWSDRAFGTRYVPSAFSAPDLSLPAHSPRRCCPRGHPTKLVTVLHVHTSCDSCGGTQPRGASVHRCCSCDYDVCAMCTAETATTRLSRGNGAAPCIEDRFEWTTPNAVTMGWCPEVWIERPLPLFCDACGTISHTADDFVQHCLSFSHEECLLRLPDSAPSSPPPLPAALVQGTFKLDTQKAKARAKKKKKKKKALPMALPAWALDPRLERLLHDQPFEPDDDGHLDSGGTITGSWHLRRLSCSALPHGTPYLHAFRDVQLHRRRLRLHLTSVASASSTPAARRGFSEVANTILALVASRKEQPQQHTACESSSCSICSDSDCDGDDRFEEERPPFTAELVESVLRVMAQDDARARGLRQGRSRLARSIVLHGFGRLEEAFAADPTLWDDATEAMLASRPRAQCSACHYIFAHAEDFLCDGNTACDDAECAGAHRCSFCAVLVCNDCCASCADCQMQFCRTCSTMDYTERSTHTLCLDCVWCTKARRLADDALLLQPRPEPAVQPIIAEEGASEGQRTQGNPTRGECAPPKQQGAKRPALASVQNGLAGHDQKRRPTATEG